MRSGARLGITVAVVRTAAFICGALALGASGLVQVWGYVLTLVGLPEILLLRSLVDNAWVWTIAGAVLVFAGSFLWVELVRRVVRGVRSDPSNP